MTTAGNSLKQQRLRYTRVAMILHWMVAVMIGLNILLIWIVDLIPEGYVRPAIDTHKSLGITVLGLVLLHLLWRAANAPPELPRKYASWERRLAKAAHMTMYCLILMLPLSGWLHDSSWKAAAQVPMKLFYLFEWPRVGFVMSLDPETKEAFHKLTGSIHVWLSYAFYGLFVLHVGGALKHQFWDRQPQLQRMVPWGKIEAGQIACRIDTPKQDGAV